MPRHSGSKGAKTRGAGPMGEIRHTGGDPRSVGADMGGRHGKRSSRKGGR